MHCTDASELMDRVLDGHDDSERQAALLAHTADCAACLAEWSAIQEAHRLLAAAPPVSPPADFTAKVMAHLSRRRPVWDSWAGAFALFAGAIVLSVLAVLSFLGTNPTAELAALLQVGSTLVGWAQAGWEIRRAMLSLVPAGLILLFALLSVVAVGMWLGLVAGVQAALRPAGE
ncbi:MAG: anti-sigma factor family protein [Anaerolineae bacterium]